MFYEKMWLEIVVSRRRLRANGCRLHMRWLVCVVVSKAAKLQPLSGKVQLQQLSFPRPSSGVIRFVVRQGPSLLT